VLAKPPGRGVKDVFCCCLSNETRLLSSPNRAAGTLEIDDIFALNNVNQRAFSLY
jgi:hypothetical protein